MQTVITKYHAPTEKRGPRYSATGSGGRTVYVKENPEWVNASTGHYAALRALQRELKWGDAPMIGDTLNQAGHQVWVFLDGRSLRSDTPPEPIGEYHNSLNAARADPDAKPGTWIVYRTYDNSASYAVVTESQKDALKPSEWKVWGRV